jgi:hypothetical protein
VAAGVTRLRPREFYAVVPGSDGGPGEGEPEPVFYERTLPGAESALAHAMLLTAGGGTQYVTLTEGRRTWICCTLQNGHRVPSPDPPVVYRTTLVPAPGSLRPGAPRGHIPEICSHAKNRAAGREPRKNPNCPKPSWPGIESITTRETPR